MTHQKGFAHAFLVIGLLVALVAALGWIFWQNFIYKEPVLEKVDVTSNKQQLPSETKKTYKGTYTSGGNFQVKIPNGWSVDSGLYDSTRDSHIVLLAGPNKLDDLKYDESKEASISPLEGFGWDGLTEHFYIISQEDNNFDLAEYTSQKFELDDGTVGKQYTKVIKTEDQSDSEFDVFQEAADRYTQYMYEFKNGNVMVRAYLNLYSNSEFDIDLAEQVIKSMRIDQP